MVLTGEIMSSLKDKVVIITGGSRGIGRATALRLAGEGAHIVVAAKTTAENPRLPGTIHATANEVTAMGARALAVKCNVRHASDLENLVDATLKEFGRIDVLINNAGAIWVEPIENTPEKRFDLVMDVNFKGPFLLSQMVIPHMQKNGWGHIINMSPPIEPDQAGGKIAYMTSKFGMTMLAEGLGKEMGGSGIACNALWPRTLVESLATINWQMGRPQDWRKADVLADAVAVILKQDPKTFTGNALIDEDVLREKGGVTDFSVYNLVPDGDPKPLDWDGMFEMMLSAREQKEQQGKG